MKILVSNLNTEATEKDLHNLFAPFGNIESVKLIRGWDSYESRGLAVVEFVERGSGETALNLLNKSDYMEQMLRVSEIRAPFSTHTLVTQY
jgi:RNA recognition motif-containing protein